MSGILLTPYSGAILGPIAKLLGFILNAVFNPVENVGVAIIIFTIIIYILMIPLTYKQQKFSKLSAKMNPEIQAIQAKYKGKKDQDSMMKQNQEMQIVYKKYGVSPSGSCVQLLIQLPILLALYRVINNIPAYVNKVYYTLSPLANEIMTVPRAFKKLCFLSVTRGGQFASYVSNNVFVGSGASINNMMEASIIDVLNRANAADWAKLGSLAKHGTLNLAQFTEVHSQFDKFNNFLGLNVSYSPANYMSSGSIALIIGALMIPFLAWLTQWLNTLFMPQAAGADGNAPGSGMMKSMGVIMPLMSAVFCFSLPIGLGIYWIMGAVIRSIEQVIINRRIDKMDLDALIEKNMEKYNVKRANAKERNVSSGSSISSISTMRTSTLSAKASVSGVSEEKRDEAMKKFEKHVKKGAKVGGIAAKANMVKDYNDRKSKDK